jgi:glycosyltransferase involved in cell wall biosynthesis
VETSIDTHGGTQPGRPPVNVLLVCYEFPPVGGGGSRVVAGLAQALVRQGYGVDVLTMAWRTREPRDCPPGVGLIEVPCTRRQVSCTSVWELMAYVPLLAAHVLLALGRRRYDVCNVHFIMPDGLVAWLLRLVTGRRFVVTAHGSDVPGYNPDRFVGWHRLLAPLWHRIVRTAEAVVCPSPTLERLIRAKVPMARTVVIPNGFDESRFAPDRPRRPRILVVSRLYRRKGVATVIEAFLGLATAFELHIVGDGPELADLRARAGKRRDIVFHGWIDNADARLRDLYETSSIFALVSEAENFPLCLLEAMASGLAIVTSAGTGCADVVGAAGVLVRPGDVAALRAALADLTSDHERARELGRAARARLEQRYSWRVVATDYMRLYRTSAAPVRAACPPPAPSPAESRRYSR